MLRRFSWVVEGELAGLAQPADRAAWSELADAGIEVVVGLTRRVPYRTELSATRLEFVHLPIPDFRAPTAEQLEHFLAVTRAARAANRALAVFCRGGFGRTGTMLACTLVDQGLAPGDAVAVVRASRPGSIETRSQVQAVYAAARSRRPRQEDL